MKPVAWEPGEVVIESVWFVFGDDNGAGWSSGDCCCGRGGKFVEEGLCVLKLRREDRGGEFEVVFESVGEGEEVPDIVVVEDEARDGDGHGFLVDGRVGEELEVGWVDWRACGGCDVDGLFVEGRKVECARPAAGGVGGVAGGCAVAWGHAVSGVGLTGENAER